MSQARLGRRLQRILLLLPYAIKHPGVTIDELSRKFDVPRRELMADLNLVFLCGLPGYGPGDLIDVDISDDRVEIRMAEYFAEPLRMTPAEALALYSAGSALAELPQLQEAAALKSGLRKLGRALGAGAADASGIDVKLETGAASHLSALQRALEERRRVEIDYFSASSLELKRREVDPWGLIAALGRWYLVGFDHLTGEERMFRTDRMKSVAMRDEPAPIPEDFDPVAYRGAFKPSEGQPQLEMEISPSAATWFAGYYPVSDTRVLDDGWQRVALRFSSLRWAAVLLLRLGAGVRAVEPPDVVDEARSLARRLAGRHR